MKSPRHSASAWQYMKPTPWRVATACLVLTAFYAASVLRVPILPTSTQDVVVRIGGHPKLLSGWHCGGYSWMLYFPLTTITDYQEVHPNRFWTNRLTASPDEVSEADRGLCELRRYDLGLWGPSLQGSIFTKIVAPGTETYRWLLPTRFLPSGNTYLLPLRPTAYLALDLATSLGVVIVVSWAFGCLKRRFATGGPRCPKCSYPLSPGARCPECGEENPAR